MMDSFFHRYYLSCDSFHDGFFFFSFSFLMQAKIPYEYLCMKFMRVYLHVGDLWKNSSN